LSYERKEVPCRIISEKPEGNRPLGRHRPEREDNIKMNIKGIAYEDVNWIHLAQDSVQWRALVNTVMNLRLP
jgi:hypothetical protein